MLVKIELILVKCQKLLFAQKIRMLDIPNHLVLKSKLIYPICIRKRQN